MNVVIIEDEQSTANRMKKLIEQIDNNINVLTILESVEDAIIWLKTNIEPELF